MIRALLVLTSLGFLTACGADGLPLAPAGNVSVGTSGVSIGGSVSAGVARNGTGS